MPLQAYKPSLYTDDRGHYHARIQSANGRIIFASSEGYENKEDCRQNLVDIATALAIIGVNGFPEPEEAGQAQSPFGSSSPSSA